MGLYKLLRITDIKNETEDCKTFFLEAVADAPLLYQPGQFLTLAFNKPQGEERRSYSFSSSPVLNEQAAITVKRVDNGEYSRKLIDYAKVGDELVTTGAAGFFTLPPDIKNYRQLFFIAAGSGITPVYSLIKTVLHLYPTLPVVLIYSNRSKESAIFYDELKNLSERFDDRLTIEWLFSSSPVLERARLSKWLLEILLRAHVNAPLNKTLFYLCGPFDYMRMATIQLLEDGVPQQNIRKENFTTFKPVIKILPPDTGPHYVTIRTPALQQTLLVQYPQTILQVAKNAGIPLPYSCEAGKCGSCVATCVSGQVWMSNNEVLMDDEIAKGRVLTCTGYPVGGDVILNY